MKNLISIKIILKLVCYTMNLKKKNYIVLGEVMSNTSI